MAKVQASTSAPPEVFSASNGIYAADGQDVLELQNLAAFGYQLGERLAGQVSAAAGWDVGDEVAVHAITFPTTSGYVTRYTGQVYIDPDVATLTLQTEVTLPASNTGRVRITVGGASGVNAHTTTGGSSTLTTTVATSSTGTGLQTLTVEVDHQTGSSASVYLRSWGVYGTPRTTSLPDPVE